MKARIGVAAVALVLLASQVFALPVDGQGEPSPARLCQYRWYASTCADEAYVATSWTETIRATARANDLQYRFLFASNEPPFDMTVGWALSAGEGAAAAIIDVNLFLATLETRDRALYDELSGALLGCMFIALGLVQGDCDALLSGVLSKVDQSIYQDSSLWWRGCWKSDSQDSRTFAAVPRKDGYIIAATAKAGSSADLQVVVTHHSNRSSTATTCRGGTGPMPPDGTYTDRIVGSAPANPAPAHGGTLTNFRTSAASPVGFGTFAVRGGQIYFTGTVSKSRCVKEGGP